MGMSLTGADLLPGEGPIMTKSANMVVSLKESGLSRFAFDDFAGLVGMEGKEAIGGEAHLTNFRVIFKSHFMNRMRGQHSIFLPNISEVSTTFNSLIVETNSQRYQFVMWFKKEFVAAINEQKARITPAVLEKLKQSVLTHPEVIGDGLQKWVTLEVINQICLGARSIKSVFAKLSGAEKNALVEVIELLNPKDAA
jgi:hypothetical protein